MRTYTFYAGKAGVEVRVGGDVKEGKNGVNYRFGRLFIRFFPLEKGGREKQIVCKLNPKEGIRIARLIPYVVKEKKTISALVHKFGEEKEQTTTKVSLDYWQKSVKKNGDEKKVDMYGISVLRYKDDPKKGEKISVPLDADDFKLLQCLMEVWAPEACYVEKVESREKTEEMLPDEIPPEELDGVAQEEMAEEEVPF